MGDGKGQIIPRSRNRGVLRRTVAIGQRCRQCIGNNDVGKGGLPFIGDLQLKINNAAGGDQSILGFFLQQSGGRKAAVVAQRGGNGSTVLDGGSGIGNSIRIGLG